jgi:hypothetical protein
MGYLSVSLANVVQDQDAYVVYNVSTKHTAVLRTVLALVEMLVLLQEESAGRPTETKQLPALFTPANFKEAKAEG